MKAFMRNTYNQTSLLRAQIQCLLKEEKAASVLGCSLSANPGGAFHIWNGEHDDSKRPCFEIVEAILSVYALCGWVGRFSSLQPILSNLWRREHSLMVVSAQVRGSHRDFFSFVLTRKSWELSLDREPKIVARRNGCQGCVLFSPLFISFIVKS